MRELSGLLLDSDGGHWSPSEVRGEESESPSGAQGKREGIQHLILKEISSNKLRADGRVKAPSMPVNSLSVSVNIQKIFNKYCLPSVVVVVHNTRRRIFPNTIFYVHNTPTDRLWTCMNANNRRIEHGRRRRERPYRRI